MITTQGYKMDLIDKYLGEAEEVWATQIWSKTHTFMFIGGGYVGKPENDAAKKKAKLIRKKHPELKSGTISISKFNPKNIKDELNKLIELPIGAQR